MTEHRINLEEVAQQADIVTVISHYLTLTKKGRNYLGICPFHDDSNPSMNVNPEKRIYKCFSCGAAGSAFTFVQNYEKIPFIQAVRKVADLCGIVLPETSFQPKASRYSEPQEVLIKALSATAQFYHYSLSTEDGKAAEDYLLNRGLTPQLIKDFQLGYAPADSEKLMSFLKGAGHQDDAIIASSIGYRSANQQLVDYQRGRVIFPIHDSEGNTLGFSGRLLKDIPNEAKYTNTSESTVFQKGKILFNLHGALATTKKDGYLYLVEGFMDAITLHRVGLTSVVATMGTALTKEHVAILAALKVEIRLALDFDRAGLAAMQKAILLLKEAQVKVRVVQPPEHADDADELFARSGADSVVKLYTTLIDPVQFMMHFYATTTNFGNYEARRKYADIVMRIIVQEVQDPLTRDYYVAEVARKSGFSIESLMSVYLSNVRRGRKTTSPIEDISYPQVKEHLRYYERVERELIKSMILDRRLIAPIVKDFEFNYMDDVCRQIAFYLYDLKTDDELTLDRLINLVKGEAAKQFIGELIGSDRPVYTEETIKSLITNHNLAYTLQKQIDAAEEEKAVTSDRERSQALLKEITALRYQLRQVAKNK